MDEEGTAAVIYPPSGSQLAFARVAAALGVVSTGVEVGRLRVRELITDVERRG